jgi:hypothetical protein
LLVLLRIMNNHCLCWWTWRLGYTQLSHLQVQWWHMAMTNMTKASKASGCWGNLWQWSLTASGIQPKLVMFEVVLSWKVRETWETLRWPLQIDALSSRNWILQTSDICADHFDPQTSWLQMLLHQGREQTRSYWRKYQVLFDVRTGLETFSALINPTFGHASRQNYQPDKFSHIGMSVTSITYLWFTCI